MNTFTSTITALSLLLPSAAVADWYVTVEGPDVFGEKSARLVGEISGSQDVLVFDCASSGELSAQWLVRVNDVSSPRELDTVIILRSAPGEPVKINGKLTAWNDKYVALTSTRLGEIVSALSVISNAVRDVQIGYIIPEADIKESGSVPATGSTRSVKTFMSHCSIR